MGITKHIITEANSTESRGYRLGRHVEHDERSIAFAHHVVPKSAIASVAWPRRIPILDQGNLGSCTGNAVTGLIGTDSKGRIATSSVTVTADTKGVFKAGTRKLDETFAVDIYKLNTRLDEFAGGYPPDDTGSSGIAAAKSGQQLGLFSKYTHAFSYDAMLTALQVGPVIIGIPWYNSMYSPTSAGQVTVSTASGLAGGHELLVREYNATTDVVWIDNSWGTGWGKAGRAYIKGADMKLLLSNSGDVTVPVFASAVPPTPGGLDVNVLAAYTSLKTWAAANGVV